ncbi:MAG: AGE family epimerase/isomerase [bacterium]
MRSLLPKLCPFLFTALLTPPLLFAQYTVQSPYLQNPSLAIGYMDSCAAFWESSWDNELGGFYTNVARDGSTWGTDKFMLTQSRNAYGLVRAYMVTGDTTFLHRAHDALLWMVEHAWDGDHGGWYQELDQNGNPTSRYSDKTAFYQHYALLGIAAYVEATQDSTMGSWLLRGYQHLEDHFWDNRNGYEGYFNLNDADGGNPRNKSFNATVDAVTTHLLALERMTGDQKYKERLEQVGDEMVTQLVARIDSSAIGFPQEYDSDWNVNHNETMTLMGHVLKTGWCLARLQQVIPNTIWLPAAEKSVLEVWDKGYDHVYGGPYKDYRWTTGEEIIWDSQYGAGVKAWWQMEQAVTAGLQLYRLTGDDRYLEMADETLEFFMRYFVDHQYGEVYTDRMRQGGQAWGDSKGGSGKAGYHSIETGYYVYTYGGLMLTGDPVTLHYHIAAADSQRTLQMKPIALDDEMYVIAAVMLDEEDYSDFDGTAHTLTIPQGTGGEFVVTYQSEIPFDTPEIQFAGLLERVTISRTYPNPFNGMATVVYTLPARQNVRLALYDVQGREVQRIAEGVGRAGENVATVNASQLSSGVYFLHLVSAHDQATRRIVLIK